MAIVERRAMEFNKQWEYMQKGISKLKSILEGLPGSQFTSAEHMMLYTTIYDMCTRPPFDFSMSLYDKYRESIEEYINLVVLPALREKHDEFMLRELVKRWRNHKIMLKWLSHFFHYLDRYFVARMSFPSLRVVGVTCFHKLVYQEIRVKARDAVISLMEREREGQQIDCALLKNIIDIFVEIGMGSMDYYVNDFEEEMLKSIAMYYSRKASHWVMKYASSAYVSKAEDCLKQEKEMCSRYLHSSSVQTLLKKVQHELLSKYAHRLLEKDHSECPALLRDGKMDDLSRIYRLSIRIPQGLNPVVHIFKQHVIADGIAIIKQIEDSAVEKKIGGLEKQIFGMKFIELHDKYSTYVSDCFMDHSLFQQALTEAFVLLCDKGIAGFTTSELLATFCDIILRPGGREKLNDETIDRTFEKVAKLLSFVSDKALFAEIYRKQLAHRILGKNCIDEGQERSILLKFKQHFGGQFTWKLEGMVTDLSLATETQASFEEYLNTNCPLRPSIDLTVTVLTSGFWLNYKSFDFNLPAEMVKCVEAFKEFYHNNTRNRKLTWIYSLGTCHIYGHFETKTIELLLTPYQASLVLLFNDSDRLSFSEIRTLLNLPDDEIVRLVHSLSCGKYKILKKEPNTKFISPTDSFEYNSKFTNKERRIKIPPLAANEKKSIEDTQSDGRYAIDACIVRIMKSRQVLDHQRLVMECIEQLSRMFKPDLRVIKRCIENLIQRDYLERDEERTDVYRYLP